ncbi:GNAT family N-acetyltransferase [Chelativorans sp.]|uniref:GNAT family N-acetyltransferase n=1 Tax=Chelativorans sp. TaxID=2203393 RepID=UPI0028119E67|nr:GNAT family N-acetyltransferase [Chelativorans sp.]
MSSIPVLETERLVLREHRPEDLEAYQSLWSDPAVTRFTSRTPINREQAWGRIMQFHGMWKLCGYGMWIVEEKVTASLLGEVGLLERRREIQPSLKGTIEAGWMLVPSVHGRGIAREAMESVFSWAGKAHPGATYSCIINPENEASLKLAGRLGFAESARTTYQGHPTVILRRR